MTSRVLGSDKLPSDPRLNPLWGAYWSQDEIGYLTAEPVRGLFGDTSLGGIYDGIFGATTGDVRTSTGEAIPVWFWLTVAVIGGAVVWRLTR